MNRFGFPRPFDIPQHRASASIAPDTIETTGESADRPTLGLARRTEEPQTANLHSNLARQAINRRLEFADRASGNGPARASVFSARWICAGAAMAPAEEYRRKAEDMRKKATSVADAVLRQAYLDVADGYDHLAMEIEKTEAQKRGIS